MKKSVLRFLFLLPLLSLAAWADTYNNFTSFNDYWHPLGYPNTATYGETFNAPTDGADVLDSIGFYMGDPYQAGDIELQAYIATWNGSSIGSVVYHSGEVDYANTGGSLLSFNNINATLTSGGSYVAFLTISNFYGDSTGEAYVSSGSASIPGGSFVYANNSGDFSSLFTNGTWSTGLQPDWAINAEFSSGVAAPEPASLGLIGLIGGLGLLGARFRRRQQVNARA
jgi:hypothetical protein